MYSFFFFHATCPPHIYPYGPPLSLPDALTISSNPIGARVRSSKPKESGLAATKSISRFIAGNRAAWRPCWTEAPRLRRRWRFAGELLEAIGVRLAIERDQGDRKSVV